MQRPVCYSVKRDAYFFAFLSVFLAFAFLAFLAFAAFGAGQAFCDTTLAPSLAAMHALA